MSQNEIPDIDELLNSFLDGELDQRRQTEVQRLINNDEQIARRLQELRNCKRLVSSLPYTEAPRNLLGKIKASLEEKNLVVKSTAGSRQGGEFSVRLGTPDGGARHLFFRQLTAAAAMIALVGVFAVLIYTIIAPVPVIDRPVAVEPVQPREVAAVLPAVPFTGKLELKTANLTEVAAFLSKVIEFNIPSGQFLAAAPDMIKDSHVIACSRQDLKTLLDELETIWDKFDSATLFVDTDRPEGQIVIGAITPEQITEIAGQNNIQTQSQTARFFAATNYIAGRAPGKEVLVAIDDSAPPLMTIPKPVLTSNEKPVTTAGETEAVKEVSLTIVVTGSE